MSSADDRRTAANAPKDASADHAALANAEFANTAPALSVSEVAEFVRTNFGLAGNMTSLVSERDQNLMLETPGGRYIIKFSNPGETDGILRLQCDALVHLAAVDETLSVPRIVPATTGSSISNVSTSAGPLRCRVVTCLDGQPLATSPKTPEVLADLGRFIGRLTRALNSFGDTAAHRPEFLWNLTNAQSVRALTVSVHGP